MCVHIYVNTIMHIYTYTTYIERLAKLANAESIGSQSEHVVKQTNFQYFILKMYLCLY